VTKKFRLSRQTPRPREAHHQSGQVISGKITTTGIESTVAHIHEAAPGKNGPPIITLEKARIARFRSRRAPKLTDEQYKSFKAGNLYVNVHSAEHKDGEIRTQLKP